MKNKKYNYKYDREKALKVLDSLKDLPKELIKDDLVRTRSFVELIFDEFEGSGLIEEVNFAFVIPTRASRFDENYWEEVYDFFPALRYMKPSVAFEMLSSIPPFRIEMYGSPGKSSSGVLIFAPIFNDMMKDYRNNLLLVRSVRKKINEAVSFAHNRFGVKYVGLGATLPKLTDYGRKIKADVVTTTGHAGTTYLIVETVLDLIDKKSQFSKDITIGFVGGGAIGLASMQALAKKLPNAKFITYDKREKINVKNVRILKKYSKQLMVAKSNKELLEKSNLIVSAITSTIDTNGIDLTGKVIVDDSQPGSFSREQVEKSGGELLWVVGKDQSEESFVTRRQGYSYGPHGLHHSYDLWGCEAEVAAIAHADLPDAAVKDAVTISDIERIGSLFEELGVGIADYQSHGELNS